MILYNSLYNFEELGFVFSLLRREMPPRSSGLFGSIAYGMSEVGKMKVRYTGPLHACKEIYMLFNHGQNHWLCLNVNVEKRVADLFDSIRCITSHEDQENQARLLIIE
ncbi:unnamed protein product [Camellia sinensis]